MMKFFGVIFLFVSGCAHLPSLQTFDASGYSGKTVLGPGDVIDLKIFDEKDLSGNYQVGSDGALKLPLIGNVAVNGLTREEAALLIASEYGTKYLKNPEVSIFIQQHNSRKIFLLGEVRTPGPYAYEENMTVIGAIAKAGGTTVYAASNHTIVTRNMNGKLQKYVAKVADMGRGDTVDLPVMPGDVIFVPQSLF